MTNEKEENVIFQVIYVMISNVSYIINKNLKFLKFSTFQSNLTTLLHFQSTKLLLYIFFKLFLISIFIIYQCSLLVEKYLCITIYNYHI